MLKCPHETAPLYDSTKMNQPFYTISFIRYISGEVHLKYLIPSCNMQYCCCNNFGVSLVVKNAYSYDKGKGGGGVVVVGTDLRPSSPPLGSNSAC